MTKKEIRNQFLDDLFRLIQSPMPDSSELHDKEMKARRNKVIELVGKFVQDSEAGPLPELEVHSKTVPDGILPYCSVIYGGDIERIDFFGRNPKRLSQMGQIVEGQIQLLLRLKEKGYLKPVTAEMIEYMNKANLIEDGADMI